MGARDQDARRRGAGVRQAPLAVDDRRRDPGAGRAPGADRRAADLARRGRGRGDGRDLSVRRVGDPRLPAAREADRDPRAALRAARPPATTATTTATRTTSSPCCWTPRSSPSCCCSRCRSWSSPAACSSAWSPASVPIGALVSAAIAGYVLVGVYEWTHYLIHTAYRPRSRAYRRDLAQPPPAPLQERALLARDHEHGRRPGAGHRPRPARGTALADGAGRSTPGPRPKPESEATREGSVVRPPATSERSVLATISNDGGVGPGAHALGSDRTGGADPATTER